jgi:hypothetical protein
MSDKPISTKISEAFLNLFTDAELMKLSSWTKITKCPITDAAKQAALFSLFGDDSSKMTVADVRFMLQYATWRKTSKSSVPERMVLDAALATGAQITFSGDLKESKCIITDGDNVQVVPCCRVPIPESRMPKRKTAEGTEPAMRPGSDIVAASMAAMTRWDGRQVTFTMVNGLEGFKFEKLNPDTASAITRIVPSGPPQMGHRGRTWAHFLMEHFQQMQGSAYMELAHEWCMSVFKLKAPGEKGMKAQWVTENFGIYGPSDSWYPIMKKPALIRSMRCCLAVTQPYYESYYAEIAKFGTLRQGNNSGIGMVSQSMGSWGLPSYQHIQAEVVISLFLATQSLSLFLSGASAVLLLLVRASVTHFRPSAKVYEAVEVSRVDESAFKLAMPHKGSIHIVLGADQIATVSSDYKKNSITYYSPDTIYSKYWAPIEAIFRAATVPTYYFGCALPPCVSGSDRFTTTTSLSLFIHRSPWDCGVIVTHEKAVELKMAGMEDNTTTHRTLAPITPERFYPEVMKAMNTVLSAWAVSPGSGESFRFALFRPYFAKKGRLHRVYDDQTGEYVTIYDPDEAEEEEEGTHYQQEGTEDSDQEPSEEDDKEDETTGGGRTFMAALDEV